MATSNKTGLFIFGAACREWYPIFLSILAILNFDKMLHMHWCVITKLCMCHCHHALRVLKVSGKVSKIIMKCKKNKNKKKADSFILVLPIIMWLVVLILLTKTITKNVHCWSIFPWLKRDEDEMTIKSINNNYIIKMQFCWR